MLKKLVLFIATFFSIFANSETISYYGYSLDTNTAIVSGEGLQWLQWSQTTGMSISAALESYGSDGWRLATSAEMSQLLYNFQFLWCPSCTDFKFDTNEKTTESVYLSAYGTEEANVNRFITLFGDSIDTTGSPETYIEKVLSVSFGDDSDNNGRYERVSVKDDNLYTYYIYDSGYALGPYEGISTATVTVDDDYYDNLNHSIYGYGVALVRTSEVPIPSALLLFLSASTSTIFLQRRRLQKKSSKPLA